MLLFFLLSLLLAVGLQFSTEIKALGFKNWKNCKSLLDENLVTKWCTFACFTKFVCFFFGQTLPNTRTSALVIHFFLHNHFQYLLMEKFQGNRCNSSVSNHWEKESKKTKVKSGSHTEMKVISLFETFWTFWKNVSVLLRTDALWDLPYTRWECCH